MAFVIKVADVAEEDLTELYDYIRQKDGRRRAWEILSGIKEVIGSLATHPERGKPCVEQVIPTDYTYRELIYKGFRVLYQVVDDVVLVSMVVHHSRDLATLIQRRT